MLSVGEVEVGSGKAGSQGTRGRGGGLLGRNWLACWHERGVHIAEQQPLVIKEYDYDEEFCHLRYTASLVGSSKKPMGKLTEIARKATSAFLRKPNLGFCGASIATSALQPKFAYQIAFAKAPTSVVRATESACGVMLRHSMSVAQGFPWDVSSCWTQPPAGFGVGMGLSLLPSLADYDASWRHSR